MSKKSEPHKAGHTVWIWLVLGAVVLFILAFHYVPALKNSVEELTDWAEDIISTHPFIGAFVFFLFSAVSAVVAFASSVVLVPPANLVWGKIVTFFLLWGGWTAGAIVTFGIGRLAGPLMIRMGHKEKFEKYQGYVSKHMKFWAVLLFCMAAPSEIPGYVFGSAHYPFLKFLAAISIAEAIFALGITVAGESLLEEEPLPLVAAAAILLLILIIAGLGLRKLKRRNSKKLSSN